MKLRKKISAPKKVLVVTGVVLYTAWILASRKKAFKNAVSFVTTYHSKITKSIEKDMPDIMSGLIYDDMMESVLKILDAYSKETATIPQLLNRPTLDIVESLQKSMKYSIDRYLEGIRRKTSHISSVILPNYVQSMMVGFDTEFKRHVKNVDSDEDVLHIVNYYNKMIGTLRPRVFHEVNALFSKNTDSRISRITEFSSVASLGMLETYRRAIDTAKKISTEMNVRNQVKNIIIADIQERTIKLTAREITYDVFEDFVFRGTDIDALLDELYMDATEIRSGVSKEIEFRVSRGHIPSMLVNSASSLFLRRFESVKADKVLTGDQKKSLADYSRNLFETLKASTDKLIETEDYSVTRLQKIADDYLRTILPEARTYVWAIFIEFAGVMRRARLEGSQSCVVQFFHMRRVMNYDFFFAMCEEESFDLDKTRVRFEDMYDSSMKRARSKMISLARMPYITFQYEDSYEFLNDLSELLFFADDSLRTSLDGITDSFHEKLADSVGIALDMGIGDVFEEEASDSRSAVMEIYDEFEGNMKVFKVSHIVDDFAASLFGEIAFQSDFVTDQMEDLINEFKSDTIAPYTEEFFEETQKSFITDSVIDYDGMKRYIVTHMNEQGAKVLEEYDVGLSGFIESKIVSVGEHMEGLLGEIKAAIGESPLGDDDKAAIFESLDRKVVDVNGVISSTKTSLVVTLHSLVGVSLSQLDIVMDTMTQNFFNIAIQEIVEDFQEWAGPTFTGIYENSVSEIGSSQMVLAKEASTIFEEHARSRIEIEARHRGIIVGVIRKALEGDVSRILADYNTVSYAARQSIVRGNLKVISNNSTIEYERKMSSELWSAASAYSTASSKFSVRYRKLHQEHVKSFNDAYSSEVSSAYRRFKDVIGNISGVLEAIEGPLRAYYTDSHGQQSYMFLGSPTNNMPEINITTVSYPHGLISVSERSEGDLWSVMEPHLIVAPTLDDGEELIDGTVAADRTAELLGSVNDEYHSKVILAFLNYETWKKSIIDEEIATLEAGMADELRNNTCPTRPACEDGTYDCEESARTCREGYIMSTNSHGVPCCTFDPVAAGFPVGDVAKMLGIEMAWALFTDPSGIAFMAKAVKYLGRKMGTTALKAGRSMGIVTRFSTKVSGAVAKANSRVAGKIAGKTGYKVGMRVGGKMAAKLGVKVGVKIATALGKTLLKGMAKVAVSGPVGAAMLVFDLMSLALDLWDPAGYNDVQAAGTIKASRDAIIEQYTTNLANEGITSPLVADVLYNMEPGKQADFTENLVIDWYTGKISEFLSANEERWATMPVSETVVDYENETVRLQDLMESDFNFIQSIINENTENTFMVRSSTIVGTSRGIVGTSSDPDYDQASKTHLSVCSLNSAGVVAYNSFQVQKSEFVSALRKDPLYRLTKISHTGKNVYKDASAEDIADKRSLSNISAKLRSFNSDDVSEAQGQVERDNASDLVTGWAFIEMDPEEEFWRQYTHSKETGSEGMPSRANYIKAWDSLAKEQEEMYEKTILSLMEEHLAILTPVFESAATVEMVKNKSTDSPAWYPDYDDLYSVVKESVDENVSELLELDRAALLATEAAGRAGLEASDKEIAASAGISIREARRNRRVAENGAKSQPLDPDYAIFKDGFGQMSPLYFVKKTCDDMEHGNYFDTNKGLCEFTRQYCQRYGLTYFYNEDVGTHDCKLTGVQKGFETVFGTTVTRSVTRGSRSAVRVLGASYTSQDKMGIETSGDINTKARLGAMALKKKPLRRKYPVTLGVSGNTTFVESQGSLKDLSVFDKAVQMDKLGLGSRFSIWN